LRWHKPKLRGHLTKCHS